MPDTDHDDAIVTPDHDGEREEPTAGEVCGYPVDRTADDWPDAADAADADAAGGE